MKIVLCIAALLIFAVYMVVFRKAHGDIVKQISYGPFTIVAKASSSKQYNMNYGMVNRTDVAYSLLYNGKAVQFPGSLQTNTGLPFLWKVYALTDLAEPTLIAGSQSLYLIYIKDGQAVVEPLMKQSHDFASLQFLDAENGQPGTYFEVYSKSDTANLDQLDSLYGGRYLMVGEHAVLDVQTKQIWPFNTNNEAVENYSYPNPHGAFAFSPDQKSIVFLAEFQSWNSQDEDLPESEHALVVYDYYKDKGYTVKFDDTDTRMVDIFSATREWFEQFFEWNQTHEGNKLQLKHHEHPVPWTGRFKSNDHYYTLYPVKSGLVPIFLDFVLHQMSWTKEQIVKDETGEYTGRRIELVKDEIKLDIHFDEEEQSLSLSKHLYADDTPESQILVKKIADAFDAELKSGKHQEHFGRILSETKKIRGLYKTNKNE
ncbi:MAG: hypothetical protein IPI50_07095 [Saprospiraceae bacterium]|nr:hypothetical protein [Saprospiraceae bacterium]